MTAARCWTTWRHCGAGSCGASERWPVGWRLCSDGVPSNPGSGHRSGRTRHKELRMDLTERIDAELKTAMKASDATRVSALRMLKADVVKAAIDSRHHPGRPAGSPGGGRRGRRVKQAR